MFGEGTYNADGIKAIADAIAVSTSVTSVRAFKNSRSSGVDRGSAHCPLLVV